MAQPLKKQTCPEPTCGEPAESSRGISRLRFAALSTGHLTVEMTRISALIIHNQYNTITNIFHNQLTSAAKTNSYSN